VGRAYPLSGMDDISTREDCARLVRAFYERALVDEVIGFLFTDVAHLDLEHHLPRITCFWETVLLGARSYGGGAFRPHLQLNAQVPLRAGHFQRWLWLWNATVDEHFNGPVAEAAKQHADRVANAFYDRIETINRRRGRPDQSGQLTPVSCSDSDHRAAATTSSLAALLTPTIVGLPRHSPSPSGPT
jgi:hemoglobin